MEFNQGAMGSRYCVMGVTQGDLFLNSLAAMWRPGVGEHKCSQKDPFREISCSPDRHWWLGLKSGSDMERRRKICNLCWEYRQDLLVVWV